MTTAAKIEIPGDYRGAMTPRREAERRGAYQAFADALVDLSSTVDFKLSARGWCYILEDAADVLKSDFDLIEGRINVCRKEGFLPLDFTADDSARGPQGRAGTSSDYPIEEELEWLWESKIQDHLDAYAPVRWVDFQPYYVEVGVEKVDLVGLNLPIAREFRTLVSNFRGDTDINSKAQMYLRLQRASERGQTPVLLLEGDHDPKGLHIHEYMRKQFEDLRGLSFADGTELTWNPSELIIERLGLNNDFIRSQGLSTIPNLITGSGKDLADPNHRDRRRKLPYIETYLEQFGAWKCEANALVTRTEAGRELFRQALMPYVDRDGVRRYNEAVAAARAELRQAMPAFLREKLVA